MGGRKITTKLDIFVSYSHEDVDVVKPIVRLLRTVDTGVFIDRDDIHLGKRWRQEILNAIDASQAIWLFWCQHAADSKEIRLEYETGHQKHKDILPILLDSTPLPRPLDEYQWLDLSNSLGRHEEHPKGRSKYRGVSGKHRTRSLSPNDARGYGQAAFLANPIFYEPLGPVYVYKVKLY